MKYPEIAMKALSRRVREEVWWIGLLALFSLILGALISLFWVGVVDLPNYKIMSDGSATISADGLAALGQIDVWFAFCGVVVGGGIGLVTWCWFRPLGFVVPVLSFGAAFLAGIICWQFSGAFGQGDFVGRLAAASPGDVVLAGLELRSWPALFVWPLAALIPVLVAATFTKDPQGNLKVSASDVSEAPFGDITEVIGG